VVLASPLATWTSRALANLGFAFAGFAAVLWMGRRLGGPSGGLLALLFLALTPVYYGHSFYNAKDIPFAAMYALAAARSSPATSGRGRGGAGSSGRASSSASLPRSK
jgi:hypothetical protein